VSRAEETRREFTLQAGALSTAPTFVSEDLLRRMREGLGDRRSGRILDLACGAGIVVEALAADAERVVGVDLTPEMLRRARERCADHANVELHEGAVESLPFADGSFDAVVTRLSIHHFQEPARALGEARRVLAAGGRLVVLDIVASEVPEEALLHNSLEALRDPSHVRLLPASELRQVIASAGFAPRAEQRWEQPRDFSEWASIVAAARRLDPLEPVMAALARAGLHAGVGLRLEDGVVRFTHHWMLVAAEAIG